MWLWDEPEDSVLSRKVDWHRILNNRLKGKRELDAANTGDEMVSCASGKFSVR